jgi:outer membrane protein
LRNAAAQILCSISREGRRWLDVGIRVMVSKSADNTENKFESKLPVPQFATLSKTRSVLAALAVCGAVSGISVASASAMTLEEALVLAYQNNPTLQAQRAQVRATDEGVNQAIAGWRPQVEGSVFGNSTWSTRNNDNDEINRLSGYGSSLTVTQNIYDGGQTTAATEEAESNVLAERARLHSTEQGVLLDAVTAYMDVFRDTAVLQLNINNEKVLARQLAATRDRFNVGEVTRTDVAQAEARLAGARADRVQSEGNLETSRGVFRQIVGEMPDKLNKPDVAFDLPTGQDETIKLAIDYNPDVVAAKFDEAAARHNVRQNIGALLPSVDLSGEATQARNQARNQAVLNRDSLEYELKAEITVPIYQQGTVYSQVREAKQLAARARMQIEEARRKAVEDATSGWQALATARARIRSLNAEVRAAQIALEGVQQEALVGSRTVLDVLDAEQELLDAKVDLVVAERDEIVARFDVLDATGRLTGPNLKLPVGYYDASLHYKSVRTKFFGLGDDLDPSATKGKSKKP